MCQTRSVYQIQTWPASGGVACSGTALLSSTGHALLPSLTGYTRKCALDLHCRIGTNGWGPVQRISTSILSTRKGHPGCGKQLDDGRRTATRAHKTAPARAT